MKLVGIVILYNPSKEIFDIYKNLTEQIDSLIYIDNSDVSNKSILSFFNKKENCIYHAMKKNVGLAKALIYGCDMAIKMGYTHAILFDQDTWLAKDSIYLMIKENIKYNASLISPNIYNLYRDQNNNLKLMENAIYEKKVRYVDWTITSGSIIDLNVYNNIGGFDSKLFIGQIDQDYCCKLYKNGYKVLLVGNAFIYQEAGKIIVHNLFYKRINDPNYTRIRYYYIFRNERYLRKKWRNYYKRQKVHLWKYLLIIVLYSKNKFLFLYSCIKGWHDGINM